MIDRNQEIWYFLLMCKDIKSKFSKVMAQILYWYVHNPNTFSYFDR